jgi:hypothetical protein
MRSRRATLSGSRPRRGRPRGSSSRRTGSWRHTRARWWSRRRRYRSYRRYSWFRRSRRRLRRWMDRGRRAGGCTGRRWASRGGRRRSSSRSYSGRRSSWCRRRWALTSWHSSWLGRSSGWSRGLRLRRGGLGLLRFSRSFLCSQSQEVLTHQFSVRIIDGARMRLLFRDANFG